MKKIIQKNFLFIILFVVMVGLFIKRYSYLQIPIVSNPDSQVIFCTDDSALEQTWQPKVETITKISISYYAENDFSCNMQIEIFSDDYSSVLGQVKQKVSFQSGKSGELTFDLGKTKLIQGERYRIRFSFLESDEEGMLRISSGSNYGGCTVSGEEVEQAVALKITFAKSSRLFWIMASLLPLLCFTLVVMVLTERKFEETAGFSLFVEGLILYGFGWFDCLILGIWAVYLLAVLSLLAAIWIYNKKNIDFRELLSPGLWVFVIMFAVILISSHGDWLGMRDDMRHWGIAVQDMFYYDTFARHADSTVILSWYFPFASLIEYVFEYMNGMFSEDILLIAYQTMILSILIIVCRPLSQKGGKRFFLPVMASMICIPVIFFPYLSSSIMVDGLMMALIAYVLICYYDDKTAKFNYIRIACALAALTLIKDIGLIFAGMLALIMFVDMAVMQIRNKKIEIRKLLYPVVCVVMILALFLGWQFYVSLPVRSVHGDAAVEIADEEAEKDGAPQEASAEEEISIKATAIGASGITLDGLKKVLSGDGEEYQYKTWDNFVIELFDGETYHIGFLTVSFVELMGLLTFLVLSLGYFGFWQDEKARMNVFVGAVWLAGLVLCAFMLVIYMFTFSLHEAMSLTSFDRYLAPYLCGLIMAIFYLIYSKVGVRPEGTKKGNCLVYALALFFVISMPVEGIVVEAKDIEEHTTDKVVYGHEQIGEILQSVARRGEKAYFICSSSSGYSEYIFRNTVCPIISEHWGWDIVASKEIYQEKRELYGEENVTNYSSWVLAADEWKRFLQDCQYVVVFHADELFIKSYADLFEEPEAIKDGSVYQVICNEDDLSLRLIGSTGIKEWQ